MGTKPTTRSKTDFTQRGEQRRDQHQKTKPTTRSKTDFTQQGEQRRDQHQKTTPTTRSKTDFTQQGEQRRIKKQGTRSTPDQGRERSKKILLKTKKKQVTFHKIILGFSIFMLKL